MARCQWSQRVEKMNNIYYYCCPWEYGLRTSTPFVTVAVRFDKTLILMANPHSPLYHGFVLIHQKMTTSMKLADATQSGSRIAKSQLSLHEDVTFGAHNTQ